MPIEGFTRAAFESAVLHAVSSPDEEAAGEVEADEDEPAGDGEDRPKQPGKRGTKWKPLEALFSSIGVRGSGALTNSDSDTRTRARQLMTLRNHLDFQGELYSTHAVFVIGRQAAAKYRESDRFRSRVREVVRKERPPVLPSCIQSVLVMLHEQQALHPVALLTWVTSSRITDHYLSWYLGLPIHREVVLDVCCAPASATLIPEQDYAKFGDDPFSGLSGIGSTAARCASALLAGKHLILYGPPGVGKTQLAEGLCRTILREPPDHFDFVSATSDWTTFDTIGGYHPEPAGAAGQAGSGLDFVPGVVTRSLQTGRWLIIDEINRADIDKAFGELFTLLSGKSVRLPVKKRVEDDYFEIVLGPTPGGPVYSVPVPPHWRMIGTMNSFDKASLFQLSYAFMRRFAFVEVPIPDDTSYQALLSSATAAIPQAETNSFRDDCLAALLRLFVPDGTEKSPTLKALDIQVGPAIPLDIIGHLSLRAKMPDPPDPVAAVLEGVETYLYPQFEGRDKEHPKIMRAIKQALDFGDDVKRATEKKLRVWTGNEPPKHQT